MNNLLISKKNYFKNIRNETFIFFTFLIILIISLILLFKLSNYGFDLTDEGFYINKYTDSFNYRVSYFSEILGPIFNFLGNDIRLLRKLNIFFSLYLGFILIFKIFYKNNFFNRSINIEKIKNIIISLFFCSASLFSITTFNIITPSYNNLCFYACCILSIGLADIFRSKFSTYSDLLFIFGLFLLTLAKAPSAILFISIIFFYSILIDRQLLKKFFLLAFISFVLVFIFLIISNDYSINLLIENTKSSLEISSLRDSGHDYKGFINSFALLCKDLIRVSPYITIWTIFNLSLIDKFNLKINKFYLNIIYVLLPIIFILILFRSNNFAIITSFYISFPLSIFIIYLKRNLFIFHFKNISLSVLLFIFPLIFTFGTNNNYLNTFGNANLFFLASGLSILSNQKLNNKYLFPKKIFRKLIIFISIISLLFTFFSIIDLNFNPYRQEKNLLSYTSKFNIGKNSSIYLSDSLFNYLSKTKSIMKENNFKEGDYILDLTGRSPGFIAAHSATPLASPWLTGSYIGSNKIAKKYLKNTNFNDLSKAWILIEPEGKYALDPDLLSEFGINIFDKNKYKVIFKIPTHNISIYGQSKASQYLLKPIDVEIIN